MVPYPFYNPNQPVGMDAQNSMSDPNGYGVSNQMPQSMNPQPSSLPVTYQDRQSLFGMRPTYASGGQVSPLAQYLQSMGQGSDTVLAHINPEEAMELQQRHGGNINPETGLPQFGFFKNFFKDVLPELLPIAASVVGNMFGGPMGGAAAGGITKGAIGAMRGKNPWKEGLTGAGHGALTSIGMNHFGPMLGGSGGAGGFSLGSLFGGNSAMGMGSAAAKRAAAMESLKGLGTDTGGGGSGLFGNIGSFGSNLWNSSSLLDKGLLTTAIAGTLFGKNNKPEALKTYSEDHPILSEPQWRPDQMPGQITPLNRQLNQSQYDPYQSGYAPERQFFGNYADGGRYYTGMEGGQDDNINARVSPGEFVIDADTVSSLGDGNNAAGAKKLDMFRHAIREHKRSTPINKIPPKAKPITEYMFGGRI